MPIYADADCLAQHVLPDSHHYAHGKIDLAKKDYDLVEITDPLEPSWRFGWVSECSLSTTTDTR